MSVLGRGTQTIHRVSACTAVCGAVKMRKLESRFSKALKIACKYVLVLLFLASKRQHLKCYAVFVQ